jgi:hypothetical protein
VGRTVSAYRRRRVWASVCLLSCFRFDPPLIGGNGEKRLATNTPIRPTPIRFPPRPTADPPTRFP